jgi:hypothetical protein
MGIFLLNLTMGLEPGNTQKGLLEHSSNRVEPEVAPRVCWAGAEKILDLRQEKGPGAKAAGKKSLEEENHPSAAKAELNLQH